VKKENIVIVIGLLAYALGGFAYMHSNFVSKDTFKYLVKQLDRIEEMLKTSTQKSKAAPKKPQGTKGSGE